MLLSKQLTKIDIGALCQYLFLHFFSLSPSYTLFFAIPFLSFFFINLSISLFFASMGIFVRNFFSRYSNLTSLVAIRIIAIIDTYSQFVCIQKISHIISVWSDSIYKIVTDCRVDTIKF